MNLKSIDWKYIVMFVVTLVCALVPVVWQSKQEARAITVKYLSSTTLQLDQQAGIKDLQVAINGRNIDRPYMTGITCIVGAVLILDDCGDEIEASLPLGKGGLFILILVIAGLGARQIAKRINRATSR